MAVLRDVGMIAANTSRTRAYLAALERHSLLPSWTLVLEDDSLQVSPGQVDSQYVASPRSDGYDLAWSETDFNASLPIKPWLERLGLDYVSSDSREINAPHVVDLIARSNPTVFIYSGYGGGLLREGILSLGKRFLHVHGGFLPDYKGSTTNYYSLLSEGMMGASAIFLTEEIDGGPILARRHFSPPKDCRDLDHLYDSAARARVLIDVLKEFERTGLWNANYLEGGTTYYVIHPVLKHIAIMSHTPFN